MSKALSSAEMQRVEHKARLDAQDRTYSPPNKSSNGIILDWRNDHQKTEDKVYEDSYDHYRRNR